MAKPTDYKKMWRNSERQVVKLTNAYLRLKDLANYIVGVHNEQGNLVMELIEDKISLDDFKAKVKENIAKSQKDLGERAANMPVDPATIAGNPGKDGKPADPGESMQEPVESAHTVSLDNKDNQSPEESK